MAKTYFEQVPLQNVFEILLDEAAAFVCGDAKWWDDAAQHIGEAAGNCDENEKSKWQLIAACYQERAQLHRDLAARLQRRGFRWP
jgi:hypothetical protein